MASDLAALTSRLEDLERRYEATVHELRKVRDIEEIRQLKYRYWRALDSADLNLRRGVLTDDFNCHFWGDAFDFVATSREEFIEKMALNFNSEMATQHQGHHPEITIDENGEHASGIWYLQDIVHNLHENTLLAGTCFYQDRYVRTKDGWKLQSSHWDRHVEIRQDLHFMPNYTGRYLKTHGRKVQG